MPVRLFLGYFVALAVCATIAFASFGIDGPDMPGSLASEQPSSALPMTDSPFRVHSHRILWKHVQATPVQVAEAQ